MSAVSHEYSSLRLSSKQASLVAGELRAIEKSNGAIRPEAVVEIAANPKSPLHRYFTWDDTEAANQYRLVQAAWLIRTVKVRIVQDGDKPTTTRAFVRVADEEEEMSGIYVNVRSALRTPEWREQLLTRALKDLEALRSKYAVLTELNEVFEAAERMKNSRKAKAA